MTFDYRGFTITVGNDGVFRVEREDFKTSTDTLTKMHAAIDAELKSGAAEKSVELKVIGLRSGELTHGTVVGVNRTSHELRLADKGELTYVMADTPTNITILTRFIDAERIYREAREKITAKQIKRLGYGRLEAEHYSGILKQLAELHAKSAE